MHASLQLVRVYSFHSTYLINSSKKLPGEQVGKLTQGFAMVAAGRKEASTISSRKIMQVRADITLFHVTPLC